MMFPLLISDRNSPWKYIFNVTLHALSSYRPTVSDVYKKIISLIKLCNDIAVCILYLDKHVGHSSSIHLYRSIKNPTSYQLNSLTFPPIFNQIIISF